MATYRYLLNISYLGKTFFGAQRVVSGKLPRVNDPLSVQGCLEMGLKLLNPGNDPIIALSSRTDSGVHALSSACHVDLYRSDRLVYQPTSITVCLNKFFNSENIPIRVIRTFLVPNSFHSRYHAISRTYLYRVAVNIENVTSLTPHCNHIPIEESDRCLNICTDKFDVEEMRKAAKLFLGLHDFRTFMHKSPLEPNKITRRVLDKLDIVEVKSLAYSPYSWPLFMKNSCEDYRYYNIYIKSSGFLYKQVRRIVASLIAVAQGKVTTRDIKFMLQIPTHLSWDTRIRTVPSYGLYLCEVEYSLSDQQTFKDHIIEDQH